VQPLAQVRAAPLAHVDTDSEVMLVWFRPDHPAAPAPAAGANGELKGGNPTLQPQTIAPKSRTAPPAPPAPAAPRTEPSRPLPTQTTAAAQDAATPGGAEAPQAIQAAGAPAAAAAVAGQGQP